MSTRRIQSIDILRGVVMVIMAIDHIRDFLHDGAQRFSPEDLTQTTTVLFFTRWMTHFCAPVFIFLAGTSGWLAGRRKTRSELARFLLTRGLWLIVAENTLILLAETFNLTYQVIIWQVMWAIGWSMVALSALIFLPWPALLAVAIAMIAGHNLLDGIEPEAFGSLEWLWRILHVGFSFLPLDSTHTAIVIYPVVPWIGVMAAGYCFGRVMDLEPARRRRVLLQLGLGLTAAFVVIRLVNGYGDPNPWSIQASPVFTILSFLSAWKYPPSLDYLLMTLGPALVALAALENVTVSERNPFLVFGRVPFFYYISHWYVIHVVAIVLAFARYGHVEFLFGLPPAALPNAVGYPADYGYSLPVIYAIWIAVVAGLYPVCLWFSRVKARSRSPVMSYL